MKRAAGVDVTLRMVLLLVVDCGHGGSQKVISKLPRWVEIGGFFLASVAGAVNAIGLMGFKHQSVSHLTGTSTLIGLALVGMDVAGLAHLSLIVLSFVFGAALSGALIDNAAFRLTRGYSLALLFEGLLLLLAMVTLQSGSVVGHLLASAACGLQNGMVSTYSGAIVRTTHMTGLFTDLGIMFGARLRGHPLDSRKTTLFLLLIAGFILGGSAGAVSFSYWQFGSLAIPACAALILAGLHWFFRYSRKARGSTDSGTDLPFAS